MRWSDQQLRAIFRKSGGQCGVCGKCHKMGGYRRYWEVDHRVPISLGGGDGLDNLSVCCVGCNRRKGDRVHVLDALD